MKEFKINFVGNDEEIKKEDILNDFDFNYLPINNLPVSYFPLNNGLLSNELKKINNEILTSGEALGGSEFNSTSFELTITSLNSPYTILVKKNINCKLNLSGTLKDIRLNKGIYTIKFDINGYNIIEKNKKEIYKESKRGSTSIILNFIDASISANVKKISSNNIKGIDLNISSGHSLETLTDNPNYKLLVYRSGNSNTLKLNKDITCDILLVGGGGGGGLNLSDEGGGGGGGGGVGIGTIILQSGTYTINIGNGGNGGIVSGSNGSDGFKGGNTIISLSSVPLEPLMIAYGGGAGGGDNGENGGSGGGGSGHTENRIGGNAERGTSVNRYTIAFYGNNGGGSHHKSGGGGGGGAGSTGNSILNGNKNGGNGGSGILSSITGMSIYYGGGGGGASANASNKGGTGGIGGGGNGGNRGNAVNGEVNKGGGGGGSSLLNSGIGGSGIVIIRVKKEDVEDDIDISNEILTSYDTRIINEINNLLEKKMIEFNNYEKPYNYLGIYPLVILIIIFWIFIFLFLLKFVHHYFVSIYLYILIFIIIFLLIFGSLWFLYTNNDLL